MLVKVEKWELECLRNIEKATGNFLAPVERGGLRRTIDLLLRAAASQAKESR